MWPGPSGCFQVFVSGCQSYCTHRCSLSNLRGIAAKTLLTRSSLSSMKRARSYTWNWKTPVEVRGCVSFTTTQQNSHLRSWKHQMFGIIAWKVISQSPAQTQRFIYCGIFITLNSETRGTCKPALNRKQFWSSSRLKTSIYTFIYDETQKVRILIWL